jgi:hypothetical protein
MALSLKHPSKPIRFSKFHLPKETIMLDLLFVGLTLVFFAACWGLVELCERV